MNLQNDIKIKQLYQILPEGVVAPASWLTQQGYSLQLLYQYVKSGWLQKVSRGSYVIGKGDISWQGGVLGLQKLGNMEFYVGGITSLNLQGYAHYLPMGDAELIYLYGAKKSPAWFSSIEFKQKIICLKKPFFADVGVKKIPSNIKDWEIVVSTPERAIFELLYQVKPDGVEFTFAAEIFEGLTTLRPSLLNELFELCNNIRTKRVFLFLASYFGHPWFNHLNTQNLELGSGRMQVVKDGVFDNRYLITVPKQYYVK